MEESAEDIGSEGSGRGNMFHQTRAGGSGVKEFIAFLH